MVAAGKIRMFHKFCLLVLYFYKDWYLEVSKKKCYSISVANLFVWVLLSISSIVRSFWEQGFLSQVRQSAWLAWDGRAVAQKGISFSHKKIRLSQALDWLWTNSQGPVLAKLPSSVAETFCTERRNAMMEYIRRTSILTRGSQHGSHWANDTTMA